MLLCAAVNEYELSAYGVLLVAMYARSRAAPVALKCVHSDGSITRSIPSRSGGRLTLLADAVDTDDHRCA
jgi:hypothetical protein